MKVHELKTDSRMFYAISGGTKRFDVRFNDRQFKVGDVLVLHCWDSDRAMYCDVRSLVCSITFILDSDSHPGITRGYVVLGLGGV